MNTNCRAHFQLILDYRGMSVLIESGLVLILWRANRITSPKPSGLQWMATHKEHFKENFAKLHRSLVIWNHWKSSKCQTLRATRSTNHESRTRSLDVLFPLRI